MKTLNIRRAARLLLGAACLLPAALTLAHEPNEIAVRQAWIEASTDHQNGMEVYFNIINRGEHTIRLTGATALTAAGELDALLISPDPVLIDPGQQLTFAPESVAALLLPPPTSALNPGDLYTLVFSFDPMDPAETTLVEQTTAVVSTIAPNDGVLDISAAWVRPTEGTASPDSASIFLTIQNNNPLADTLLSAESPNAAWIDLHQTEADGRMTVITSLELPGTSISTLGPDTIHLMAAGLRQPLQMGGLTLTLTFASGRTLLVHVPVVDELRPKAASGSNP
jgi:copper(I)-binding protein